MRFSFPSPHAVAETLRDLARRHPDEAEAYLDAHQEEWEEFAEANPENAADILEALPEEGAADLLKDLDPDDAGEVLDEMRPEAAADVLESIRPDKAASLIAMMDPDQAVDLIGALEPDERTAVLAALDPETAREIQSLLVYAADTAGGMMTTDFAALPAGLTTGEAIETLRRLHDELGSNLSYVYVVDDDGTLEGVVSFRELVFARPGQGLENVMVADPVSVTTDMDREVVSELIHRFHLVAIPVVDEDDHLVGIVKWVEAIEAIQEEAGEDLTVMFGAGETETVFTSVLQSVWMRLPWNIFNLAAGFITVFVISLFQDTLATFAILAAFMPLVAGLSGNSGAQAVAVTIRSIAIGDLPPGREWRAVRREIAIGLTRGIVIAVLGALLAAAAVTIFPGEDGSVSAAQLATIIFISMILGFFTAALAGSSIPLLLRRFGFDPAMASNIFLTMITDSVGFGVFLTIATLLL